MTKVLAQWPHTFNTESACGRFGNQIVNVQHKDIHKSNYTETSQWYPCILKTYFLWQEWKDCNIIFSITYNTSSRQKGGLEY